MFSFDPDRSMSFTSHGSYPVLLPITQSVGYVSANTVHDSIVRDVKSGSLLKSANGLLAH